MAKAIEVATELRKFADSLEKAGEMDVPYAFIHLRFYENQKESFKTFAQTVMPRPFNKKYETGAYPDLALEYDVKNDKKQDVLTVWAKIPRQSLCRIVEPAKPAVYDCDPLFSEQEEAEIGAA